MEFRDCDVEPNIIKGALYNLWLVETRVRGKGDVKRSYSRHIKGNAWFLHMYLGCWENDVGGGKDFLHGGCKFIPHAIMGWLFTVALALEGVIIKFVVYVAAPAFGEIGSWKDWEA